MTTARRVAAIGVLALAGALIVAPVAGAKAKVRTVPKKGVVTLGKVRCTAAEACVVKAAPKQVKVRVAGKAVRAKVVVPGVVGSGGKATVKLRFGSGALTRLAGHTATFRAHVVVRGSGRKESYDFKVRLRRPAASKSGGDSSSSETTPHSESISGEAPVLARPLTAQTVEDVSVKWYPRASWIRYVATGEGTTASGGASTILSTASACPAVSGSKEGSESTVEGSFPYEADFAAAASWYDPVSGEAAVDGSGSVSFRYKGHSINLTGSEPEIQINGSASQAVFRFSGSEGTSYPDQRVALLSLSLSGQPTVTSSEGKTTYTYNLMRGTLTEDGEKVFAGFYASSQDNNGFGCVSASFTLP
ncbi:MAG: HtaA domain-containing protein [Solirubrobacterales bacterium]